MNSLSTTTVGQEWLDNFETKDKPIAATLLDSMMLVSASEFASRINKFLKDVSEASIEHNEVIAVYAEREVERDKNDNYKVKAYFPGTESGSASGDGIPPVEVNAKKQDVGSEGILAAMTTKLCKSYPKICFSHPGPDLLRQKKIRKIVIVTDIIGSGRRMHDVLEAFVRVASIHSWFSYKLISFEVICYAATEQGLKHVKRHKTKPNINFHLTCPTIEESFEGHQLGEVKLLCQSYPKKSHLFLGFNNTGSLIAFSHGLPNNSPAIFHSRSKGWKPLFGGRSTIQIDIDSVASSAEALVARSETVLKIQGARELLAYSDGELWVKTTLVMQTLRNGWKTAKSVSAKTQLPIEDVESMLDLAKQAKWVTPKNSLTAMGRRELKWLNRREMPEGMLVTKPRDLYFPKQLRAL